MQFWKLYKVPLLLTLVSFLFYWFFAYELQRTDYVLLISLYSGLFAVFMLLIKLAGSDFKFLTIIAFLFRAIFILAIPNLSQDFYRFIWDGRMILEGINPVDALHHGNCECLGVDQEPDFLPICGRLDGQRKA